MGCENSSPPSDPLSLANRNKVSAASNPDPDPEPSTIQLPLTTN
jgi:hypothetical protein